MQALGYRGYRFLLAIIEHAVRRYLRFTFSFRDVEDLLAKRGTAVSYETMRRWVADFDPIYGRRVRAPRPPATGRGRRKEVFVSIGGRHMYLWRAGDYEGEVLDLLVQARRGKDAALRLIRAAVIASA